jgi:signal transduction histidine kinase
MKVLMADGSAIPGVETQRLLGRLTAGVVHDLNNYLHVLETMHALLRKRPDDPELWQQNQAAIRAMTRLTSMLLAYARGTASEAVPLDLGAIARDMVSLLGRVLPNEVTTTLEIAPALAPLRGVRAELEQLVLNLVINACDAMPAGGELLVAVRRSAGGVIVLEVSDTGVGMPSARANGHNGHNAHAADPVVSRRGGNGLGLGIVHAVVARYEGALRIANREGGGTQVLVMLPTR